jgi:hypothetical protein
MSSRFAILASIAFSTAGVAACGASEEPTADAPVCCAISRTATNDCMQTGGAVDSENSCSGVCDGGAGLRRLCADEAGCPRFAMADDSAQACDAPYGGWDAYDVCCPISYRHTCGDVYVGGSPDNDLGCAPPLTHTPSYTLVLQNDARGCAQWVDRGGPSEKEGSCNDGFFDEPVGESERCCPRSIRPSCDHDFLPGGPRPTTGECRNLGPTPPVGWSLDESEGSCAEWVAPDGAATDVCVGG